MINSKKEKKDAEKIRQNFTVLKLKTVRYQSQEKKNQRTGAGECKTK